MLISEILKKAKGRLTQKRWGQGNILAPGRECAAIAVAFIGHSMGSSADTRAALLLLTRVATGRTDVYNGAVAVWNDAPERTLQEVHDAFDAAIAIAEQQEAESKSEVEEGAVPAAQP